MKYFMLLDSGMNNHVVIAENSLKFFGRTFDQVGFYSIAYFDKISIPYVSSVYFGHAYKWWHTVFYKNQV